MPLPSPNRRLALIGGGLALLLALLGAYGLSRARATDLAVLGTVPAFVLIDQLGRPVHSEELRRQVVVADFIYTHCPDICPLLSARMQALQARVRQEGLLESRVVLLSFTVDPARDTPVVLRVYAERYQADPQAWRFLTGPPSVVTPLIVRGFYQAVQALPPQASPPPGQDDGQPAYDVMHGGRFILIDRAGRIRAFYDGTALDPEQVVRDIRHLLG